MRVVFVVVFACGFTRLLMVSDTALAQAMISAKQPRSDSSPNSATTTNPKSKPTRIEMELLQIDDGSGVYAQHWMKTIGPLDVQIRIHRPTTGEKPDVTEREAGGFRFVKVVGTLDRSGKVSFPERDFDIGDSNKFKEWIEELRLYGARGTPDGQPLWGLNKTQFTTIFESMTKTVDFETTDMPLTTMLAKLSMPTDFPLHWSREATEAQARQTQNAKLKVELKGLSTATSLAIALNEKGLGFRPNRTPAGNFELLIESRAPKIEQWPIGWPLQRPRFKAAPKLFAMVPIELTDVAMSDVLFAASNLSETPIMIDYWALAEKQLDLEKLMVSYPRKTTTWAVVLKSITIPHRLSEELWQDEAGTPFVWVTSSRVGEKRDSQKTKP